MIHEIGFRRSLPTLLTMIFIAGAIYLVIKKLMDRNKNSNE